MAKKGKSSALGLIALAVVICVVAAGTTYYVLGGFRKHPRKPSAIRPPVITLVSESKEVTLYLPKETRGGTVYLAPTVKAIEVKGSILNAALMALLATNKEKGMLANLIPKDTKLLEPIKIDKHVAQVNLSKEFVDNFSGGSDQEALTLNSVVATVVHNSDGKARRVQILVEGKNVESLGGHYDLTAPLTVDQVVLKPEVGG